MPRHKSDIRYVQTLSGGSVIPKGGFKKRVSLKCRRCGEAKERVKDEYCDVCSKAVAAFKKSLTQD